MTREEALKQIAIDEENIEELKELRGEAFRNGNRNLYNDYTKSIRELNDSIKALKVYL